MKRIYIVFLFILFILTSCAIFNQIHAIKNLEYEYDSFKIGTPSLSGMNLLINIKVRNPNKSDVTINNIVYQIFVNDIKIAEGESEKEFKIKKNETGIYSTKILIDFKDAAKFISHFNRGSDYQIEVKGDVRFKTSFGSYTFPFRMMKNISEIRE
ncbi:MAG: hypothetical protein COX48_03105 [bacterium (Candidatus Stahlbacteria) CG23_combo_of_CG06-09_8_20_14_all_34_7]|nr:MAG: hypothetical protein COX48_03105 [bacterium (Candidatus Stahlbacteria) CG23_combo_of_CG06-09_8_20_14_all_34_7]